MAAGSRSWSTTVSASAVTRWVWPSLAATATPPMTAYRPRSASLICATARTRARIAGPGSWTGSAPRSEPDMALPLPALQDLAATCRVSGEAEGDGEVRGGAPAVEPEAAGHDLADRCDGNGRRTRAWRGDAVAASGDRDGDRVRDEQLERTARMANGSTMSPSSPRSARASATYGLSARQVARAVDS